MAFVNVQGGNHQNGGTASTTVALTLTNPITSGDMLCVSVGWQAISSTDSVTVADDKGNTYTPVDQVQETNQNFFFATFYRLNITNTPQTITASLWTDSSHTVTISASFATILVDEFSGVATSAALDGHTMQKQVGITSGTAVTSGNTTTTSNGDLVYGSSLNDTGAGSITKGASFTQGKGDDGSDQTYNTEFLTQAAASSTTAATYTHGATDTFITGVMCFKAPAIPGPIILAGPSGFSADLTPGFSSRVLQ